MTVIVHQGHVLDVLPTLAEASVQCCVTSPPYWGLRDYGTDPVKWPAVDYAPMPGLPAVSVPAMTCSLGLEPDPWAFIGHLVDVFRAVRRVLRDDGTCWVNLGDCYAGAGKGAQGESGDMASRSVSTARARRIVRRGEQWGGAKLKDLMMMPARLALALQADGWWLRSDIIWAKRAPMPESTRDRPTSAHEHVFLLAKSARYYYDAEAVKQPHAAKTLTHRGGGKAGGKAGRQDDAGMVASGNWGGYGVRRPDPAGANLRNVWTLGPEPYPAAHFATFPSEIPRRCILAGSREGDTVLDPFGGSGTTGVVAANLGRDAVLIELSQAYVDEHIAPRVDAATAQQRLAL